ncbi:MAG: hypothetical protein WCJ66_07275 [Verrucomicrobiota bacterium]
MGRQHRLDDFFLGQRCPELSGANGHATNPGVGGGIVTWPYLNAVSSFEVQVSDNLRDWAPANPSDVATTPPRLAK